MSNRCGPVESVFKNDRSIHWTRCPLCLFFFGSQRWPFSTLIGERIWTSRGQLWWTWSMLHFWSSESAQSGAKGMSAQSFARFVPSSSGTCCHLPRSHSGPTPSASHSGVSDGQWQWWRWCLCMWDPQPKTPKLGIDGSWVPHFGAIAAAICDAANCSGENLSALLDNNLRRQPGFEYFDFLRSAWPL